MLHCMITAVSKQRDGTAAVVSLYYLILYYIISYYIIAYHSLYIYIYIERERDIDR